MPGYIKLCMDTWKVPFTVLTYDNVNDYTNLPIDRIKRFTLPQIGDIVRVHVLRDQGGYWLDADTIMLTDKLPETNFVGYPDERTSSIGLIYSDPHTEMFEEWAKRQDEIINGWETPTFWATFANALCDPYLQMHKEIKIHPIDDFWPETYMVKDNIPRWQKYRRFYFEERYSLPDLRPTDLLMLHNSWTPEWYKDMPLCKVLDANCTLSNILREAL